MTEIFNQLRSCILKNKKGGKIIDHYVHKKKEYTI